MDYLAHSFWLRSNIQYMNIRQSDGCFLPALKTCYMCPLVHMQSLILGINLSATTLPVEPWHDSGEGQGTERLA